MELRNGRLKLVFDQKTGALLRAEDTVSGIVHLDATADGRSDARLLRVNAPAERWTSRYADGHEQPSAEMKAADGGVLIRYPDLVAADGASLGISAEVQVRPGAADEALFTVDTPGGNP